MIKQNIGQRKTKRIYSRKDLQNILNVQYLGELWFGEPPQKMRLLFDTGSRSFYVLEAKCANETFCGKEPKYKGYKSNSYREYIEGVYINPYSKNWWHKSKRVPKFQDLDFRTEMPLDYGMLKHKARIQPFLDQQTLEVLQDDLLYDNPIELNYEKGRVAGNMAKDQVCLEKEMCLEGFKFLSVNNATDIDNDQFSGVVGLQPSTFVVEDQNITIPSFLQQLSDQKDAQGQPLIEPIFSFYLTSNQQIPGKVILGGYDLVRYAENGLAEKDIFWCNLSNQTDQFWSVGMAGAQLYGGQTVNKDNIYGKIELHSKLATIDTGTSYALAPLVDLMSIVWSLRKYYNIDCYPDNEQQDVHYQFSWFVCNIGTHEFSTLPNIQLIFNQTLMTQNNQNETISKKNFDLTTHAFLEIESEERSMKLRRKDKPILNQTDAKGKQKEVIVPQLYRLLINPSDYNPYPGAADQGLQAWVLGDQFLQSYYTIFDYSKKQIGLIESNQDEKDIKRMIKKDKAEQRQNQVKESVKIDNKNKETGQLNLQPPQSPKEFAMEPNELIRKMQNTRDIKDPREQKKFKKKQILALPKQIGNLALIKKNQ